MKDHGAIREAKTMDALRTLCGPPRPGHRYTVVTAVTLQADLYLTPNGVPQEANQTVPVGSYLMGIVRYPDLRTMEKDLEFVQAG